MTATDRSEILLAAELHRLALAPGQPPPAAVFHAADQTLAVLNRLMDSPAGTRLVVDTGSGLLLVDIDANRIAPAHLVVLPAGFNGSLAFARRSYVVLAAQPNARAYVAAPLDLPGSGPATRGWDRCDRGRPCRRR